MAAMPKAFVIRNNLNKIKTSAPKILELNPKNKIIQKIKNDLASEVKNDKLVKLLFSEAVVLLESNCLMRLNFQGCLMS